MSDKKKKPVAGKSVAGTTNSGKNIPNKSKKELEKKTGSGMRASSRRRVLIITLRSMR